MIFGRNSIRYVYYGIIRRGILENEQRKFFAKSSIYSDESTREKTFIDNCETIMLNEMGEWRRYIERAKKKGN